MEITDRLSTLEAFVGVVEEEHEFVNFHDAPSTKIKISDVVGFGLYSDEIYALLDIKRAVDDQIFDIKRHVEGKSIHQNNEIYFSLSEGSVDVEAILGVFKDLVNDPKLGKRGLVLVLGVAVIWSSTEWFNTWGEIQKNRITEETKIELKKLDIRNDELKRQHDLELKAIDIIKGDKELRRLASRSYDSFAKIIKNLRTGSSVEINGTTLTQEQANLFLQASSLNDDWANEITGRFVVDQIKKKEKSRYILGVRSVEGNKKYNVVVNMEFYETSLLRFLQDANNKGNAFFAVLKFSRKEGEIVRAEFSKINNKKLNDYRKRNIASRSGSRKKKR